MVNEVWSGAHTLTGSFVFFWETYLLDNQQWNKLLCIGALTLWWKISAQTDVEVESKERRGDEADQDSRERSFSTSALQNWCDHDFFEIVGWKQIELTEIKRVSEEGVAITLFVACEAKRQIWHSTQAKDLTPKSSTQRRYYGSDNSLSQYRLDLPKPVFNPRMIWHGSVSPRTQKAGNQTDQSRISMSLRILLQSNSLAHLIDLFRWLVLILPLDKEKRWRRESRRQQISDCQKARVESFLLEWSRRLVLSLTSVSF